MRPVLLDRFIALLDYDLWLFGAAAGLTLISGLAMASAATTIDPRLALRHDTWALIGILLSISVSRRSYRRWTDGAAIVYAISVGALLIVEVAGAERLGATRWLSIFGLSVQPSELAKLAMTLLLAQYLAGQSLPLPRHVFLMSGVLAGLPALLIFLQPDLGSASILAAIWLGMVWVAGAPRRMLLLAGSGLLALLPIGWHVLKSYQRDRLLAFIDPHADPLGAGYTIIQSVIAVGSGQLLGRGWFAGTQNQLSFLPERHSDFIFSVIGEEWGCIGCLVVVGLFGVLLMRAVRIARETSVPQGRLLAVGILLWMGYQACVNMGMVMGLLPVVGVPLPLISYGGSSMVTVWIALGLLQSIHRSDRLRPPVS